MKQCKYCGKKFQPKTDKQEDCSEICLSNRFDTFVKKTRALARILANTMGYRSMSEVRFASRLKQKVIDFSYETDTLKYQLSPQKYVVDFTVDKGNGEKIFIEYKGKLDGEARRKMRAVKKSNPNKDIRFVFEKPNNFIYKGSKTRYWQWADKFGFPWYDCRDVAKLRRDVTEARKQARKNKKAKGVKELHLNNKENDTHVT